MRPEAHSSPGRLPNRLRKEPLIRVCPPKCNVSSHGDCSNPGKRPVIDANHTEPLEKIREWIVQGGNVGLSLSNDLVAIDVDSFVLEERTEAILPATFTTQTGTGSHRIYRCANWAENRQLTSDGSALGSIRSDGWQVVIPPSTHPGTGNRYQVACDRPIVAIEPDDLRRLIAAVSDDAAPIQPPRRGCTGADIPAGYPEYDREPIALKRLIDQQARLDISAVDWYGDRSQMDWLLCKCMAEVGASLNAIISTMDRYRPSDTKWQQRNHDYRQYTAVHAVQAAVADPYVEFEPPADMAHPEAERRKTEEPGHSRALQGGESMPDFTDKDEVVIQEASETGDNFRKLVLVEGHDRDEDRRFEYVALKKGFLRDGETDDGQTVKFEQVTDSASLGSPEYLGDLIQGLAELHERVNEEPVENVLNRLDEWPAEAKVEAEN